MKKVCMVVAAGLAVGMLAVSPAIKGVMRQRPLGWDGPFDFNLTLNPLDLNGKNKKLISKALRRERLNQLQREAV